ncbi:fibronectin type III domain-containing protein [Nocardioides sp. SYSU DS0651]|uniref:fibronectin type III domain-containing protein n=1 Tax=Nocardioides sp. SYSU DS0651 TaxID=3415955 RepID=UPI003F4BA189
MRRWSVVRGRLAVAVAGAVVAGGGLLPGGTGAVPAASAAAGLERVDDLTVGSGRTNGSSARLTATWSPVRGATSYQVRYATSRDMAPARSVGAGDTSRTVRHLRASRTYCFRVRAVRKAAGRTRYGAPSAVVCARTPRAIATGRAAWVTGQTVASTSAGRRTTLTLKWPRTAGATTNELHYAPAYDVQRSRGRVVVRAIPASGRALETYVVRGLEPGRKYCFQLRGRSTTGVGHLGPTHCKVVMPAARALKPTKVELRMVTFNVCGKAEPCQARWSWSRRRPLVKQHIVMSGADVVALQETRAVLSGIARDLEAEGFVKACSWANAQAVFVRRSVYAVTWGSAGGLRFTNDKAHGGCWAKVRHRATGTQLAVASVHLRKGRGAWPAHVREVQTSKILRVMQERYGDIGARGTPRFVIGGDFNSHRGHAYDGPLQRLRRAGFDDAYDVSATFRTPYRNSANRYRARPMTSVLWGSHVDRVFVPEGATVTGWRTVTRTRGNRYVTPLPSDHSPVAMTIYLPSSGGLLGGLLG